MEFEPDIDELIREEQEFNDELDEMFKSLVAQYGYEEAVRMTYDDDDS